MSKRVGEPAFDITVGLLWHSLSSGNLGVGALTESNVAIVREAAERQGLRVRFLVLGTGSGSSPALTDSLRAVGHELECHRIRVFRSSFRQLVRQCDFVLDIGEGDSFSDIYGFRRFLFYWLSKNIVCSLGRPLILSPQTIGPFDGRLARLLAVQVMRRCRMIFSRDGLSTRYLAALGLRRNADEATDVAFRLPFGRAMRADGRVHVGMNVSGLLFNGGYTGANQFELKADYRETMRALLREFHARKDVQLHLVSHVVVPEMPVEDDLATARQLAGEFPGVIVAPRFTCPSEAKSYISGLDFFCGARMHACIAAFSAGVPVVPIAYSRKFIGLFGSLGYERIADCTREGTTDVVATVLHAFSSASQCRDEIRLGLTKIDERIGRYERALSAVMSERRSMAASR